MNNTGTSDWIGLVAQTPTEHQKVFDLYLVHVVYVNTK